MDIHYSGDGMSRPLSALVGEYVLFLLRQEKYQKKAT